jgi:hypothetical protein
VHSIFRRRMSLTILPLMPILVAACSAAPHEDVRPTDESLVDTNKGAFGPASREDLAPLPVHGNFSQLDRHGALVDYVARYSSGPDTRALPLIAVDAPAIGSVESAWTTKLGGDAYQSTRALRLDVGDALAQANADVDPALLDGAGVSALFDLIHYLGGPAPTTEKHQQFVAYEPLRARWRSSDFVTSSFRRINLSYWDNHGAPAPLAEMRDRGARLYCASRHTRDVAGTGVMSMGEQIGFKSTVLGHEIDFLVVEPTVVLGAAKANTSRPGRFSIANDGAQSFEVPMKFGTRITPIRGIGLPGLPEIRYPTALVTADGEIGTAADFKVRDDGTWGPTKRYTTLAHGDTIASAYERVSAGDGAHFVLFSTGLLTVTLGINLDFDLGKPTALKDDRVLSTANLDSNFPRTTRTGFILPFAGRSYHDGAWQTKPRCGGEIDRCPPWDWQLQPYDAYFQTTAAAIGPMDTRAWEDDDHLVQTRSALTLTGTITGAAGIPRVGPFEVTADVVGGLKGTVGQSHVIRDALYAESADGSPMRGVTGLTVRPKTDASASLIDTTAAIHLSIDLGWFGTVTWDATLFTIPGTTLASYDSDTNGDWSENATLRIGTGSSAGDPTKNPDVHTHVPGGAELTSFGPGNDVDTCLSAPADTRPEPPPCSAQPATGSTPHANTCAYANVQSPNSACANIAATVAGIGATGGMATCWTQYLQLLCSPTSYQSPALVSHVLDDGTPATLVANMSALGQVQTTCVNAVVPNTGNKALDHAAAKAFIDSFFHLAVCDGSGRPLAPSEILGPSSDTSTTPTAAGTCH